MTLEQLGRPIRYTAQWRDEKDKWHFINTDNIYYAEKKAILNNGEVYEDMRYEAKLRLYFYILRKKMYPNKI